MIKLENVVPYGRTFDEYRAMFALSDKDLRGRIVGIGDGPASFNAEMRLRGCRVVSIDPVYVFTADEIEARFYAVLDDIIAQVRTTPQSWVWSYHASPDHLRRSRIAALKGFAADFEAGRLEGRYVAGQLPRLPIGDSRFDLALCSHFLFLYSDQLDYAFHRAAVYEMLRVAAEVRIFPLLSLGLERSPHLERLIRDLREHQWAADIVNTGYHLQRGGHEMLRIRKPPRPRCG